MERASAVVFLFIALLPVTTFSMVLLEVKKTEKIMQLKFYDSPMQITVNSEDGLPILITAYIYLLQGPSEVTYKKPQVWNQYKNIPFKKWSAWRKVFNENSNKYIKIHKSGVLVEGIKKILSKKWMNPGKAKPTYDEFFNQSFGPWLKKAISQQKMTIAYLDASRSVKKPKLHFAKMPYLSQDLRHPLGQLYAGRSLTLPTQFVLRRRKKLKLAEHNLLFKEGH